MEQKKKRHNPEITPEDLAVKAFDSLESVIQESKEHPEPANIVKTDAALRKELYELIVNTFGDLNYLSMKDTEFTEKIFTQQLAHITYFTLYKPEKKKWYQKQKFKEYIILAVDQPEPAIRPDYDNQSAERTFVEKGTFSQIKITAHTTEALEKAKLFSTVYKKLTGQNVSIIQNCPDPVIKDQVLEEKVKEEAKQKVNEEEVWSEVKKELKSDTKDFAVGASGFVYLFNIAPYSIPTIKRIFREHEKKKASQEQKYERAMSKPFAWGLGIGAGVGIVGAVGQVALYVYFPPLLLIPIGTNLASAGYEWVRNKYNTVKERKQKESEGKNE